MSDYSTGLTGDINLSDVVSVLESYLPARHWTNSDTTLRSYTNAISSPTQVHGSSFAITAAADSLYVLTGIIMVSASSVNDTWEFHPSEDDGPSVSHKSYFTAMGTATHGKHLAIPVRGIWENLSAGSVTIDVDTGSTSAASGTLYSLARYFDLLEFKKRSS